MSLHGLFQALAERAPVSPAPPGLFDRARRRQRWRWSAAAGAVAVVVVLGGFAVSLQGPINSQVGDGPPGIPRTVSDPPVWTAEVATSPAGPAAVIFRGPAVPGRAPFRESSAATAVVGLTADTYRVVYPSQGTLALSPDGGTLLVPHLDGDAPDLRSRYWRTDALDLTTGKSSTLAAGLAPIGWSVDGRHALLVQPNRWDNPQAPAQTVNDMTVSIVAWPSGQPEWSVHVARPDAVEGEGNYPVALSPDGSMLAASTSHELRMYQRDGTLRWKRALTGLDVLAGPAAWRDDRRLAVMRRSTVSNVYDPGEWTIAFVDSETGEPLPDPGLPPVRSATDTRVAAWRADTAYAVVQSNTGSNPTLGRARLVRLTPGASTPQTILAPAGVQALNVATDYIDVTRAARSPSYGLSLQGLLSVVLRYTWLAIIAIIVVVVWRAHRRSRRRRIERLVLPPAP